MIARRLLSKSLNLLTFVACRISPSEHITTFKKQFEVIPGGTSNSSERENQEYIHTY
jgi:hypothetical protein